MVANPPVIDPLFIPFAEVPRLLGCSRAHVARMRVSGNFGPEVVRWGRKLLVRRSELFAWAEAGMVDAVTWQAMKGQGRRRAVC
jgi:hypothetical protein